MTSSSQPDRTTPFKPMPVRRPAIHHIRRADGTCILQSDYELPPPPRSLFHLFALRAGENPNTPFLARRARLPDGKLGDWHRITYGDALCRARAIARHMIDRGLGPDRAVMVISGPSTEHALFMLGAFAARAPYIPVSAGYSLYSTDFARLRHVFDVIRPAMIFADDGPSFEPALASLPIDDIEIVCVAPPVDIAATPFSRMLDTPVSDAVDDSLDKIRPETHARTVFTSGSTGTPKGVIHTHGMISSYIAQQQAMFPTAPGYGYGRSPILSWLPWSHVGGASGLTMAINGGSTFYIDDGGPVAGKLQETLRNLREIAVTEFPSPPALFAPLVDALAKDTAFRDFFFSKLQLIIYGAASLNQHVLDRLQELSVAATGFRTPISSKYATTETLGVSQVPWPLNQTGQIGAPNAGVTIKLAPVGDLMELRVKGPCVTPGYINDPEATERAFDEEGFFRTGDAAQLIDPEDPDQGLQFNGRVVENFKLGSGSWVHVGELRAGLIDAIGLISECVIAGHDRDDVRVLAWLDERQAAAIAGLKEDSPTIAIARSEKLIGEVERKLQDYNKIAGGVTRRVKRLVLLTRPPATGEITEKGSINQRAFLHRHGPLLDALYDSDDPAVFANIGDQYT